MTAQERLQESRIDLVKLIDNGIPKREYIPGTNGVLPVSKRLHISAPRKTGKSLVVGVVLALHIVKEGGSVAILDRENGEEEYARRLASVMEAWNANKIMREKVRTSYSYHAFPQMELSWGDDPTYVEAFADHDLVVFDSSRSHLTPLGLGENSSDDYDRFVQALINPLWRAGKTTVVLDNTGHEGKRARGTSSKGDLCDVDYSMKQATPFNLDERGSVELKVVDSRIGEMHGSWTIELGDGIYGQFTRKASSSTPALSDMAEQVVSVLSDAWAESQAGLSAAEITRRVGREKGDGTVRRALDQMVDAERIHRDEEKLYAWSPPVATEV